MGFAFVKYEDQRSTILAVDNFNGIKLLGRTLRCDHVEKYKLPKEIRKREEEELEKRPDAVVQIGPGHAYQSQDLQNEYDISKGLDLWAGTSINEKEGDKGKKKHKHKKEKKKDKKKRSRDDDRETERGMSEIHASEDRPAARSSFPVGGSSSYTAVIAASSVAPTDTAPSWRGRMDPAVAALEEAQRKKLAAGEIAKRDEFDGIGGMRRRR